jgi:hypothetical protein
MKAFNLLMTNLFGVLTFCMLGWGTYQVFSNGTYGINETTFLMFTFFILTVLFASSGKKNEEQNSEKESTLS